MLAPAKEVQEGTKRYIPQSIEKEVKKLNEVDTKEREKEAEKSRGKETGKVSGEDSNSRESNTDLHNQGVPEHRQQLQEGETPSDAVNEQKPRKKRRSSKRYRYVPV